MAIFSEVLMSRTARPDVRIPYLHNYTYNMIPRDENLKICLYTAETNKV
jgi:hypothetical protein